MPGLTHSSKFFNLFAVALVTAFVVSANAQTLPSSQTPEMPAPKGDEAKVDPSTTNPEAPEAKSQKTTWVAHLLRRRQAEHVIKGLELIDQKLPIVLVPKSRDLKPTITIRGRFNRPGWKLFLQGTVPVEIDPATNEFKIFAHLPARVSEVYLIARGPNYKPVKPGQKPSPTPTPAPPAEGETSDEAAATAAAPTPAPLDIEDEHIYVYAPEAVQFHVVSAWDQLLLSAGFSFLSYTQGGFGEYQALSALLSARYNTPEGESSFGLLADAQMSVLTFIASPVDRGPQLLQIKLDGTVELVKEKSQRWRMQLLGGGSYLTMFSYGSPFGFEHLIAPELGFRARKIENPTRAWVGEGRIVFLGGPTEIGEMGLNLSSMWSKNIGNNHRIEYGVEYNMYLWHPVENLPIRVHQLAGKLGLSI